MGRRGRMEIRSAATRERGSHDGKPAEMVRRHFQCEGLEVRAGEVEGDGPVIEGYAILWGEPSVDMGFTERIARGAFTESIAEGGQFAFWGHDTRLPLGREKNSTLQLVEDEKGLRFTLTPNMSTSWGVDAHASIERGDVDQMSFGFRVLKEDWDLENQERTVLKGELMEVSPVAFPAYSTTTVSARDWSGVIVAEVAPGMTAGERDRLRGMVEAAAPGSRCVVLDTGVVLRRLEDTGMEFTTKDTKDTKNRMDGVDPGSAGASPSRGRADRLKMIELELELEAVLRVV